MQRVVKWMGLAALTGLFACSAIACTSSIEIAVDVRTDLVAGEEFDSVRVSLDGEAAPLHHARPGEVFATPRRVAEFAGAQAGRRVITVELMRAGAAVVTRRVAVRLQESVIVLAVLTRDCRGVVCPGGGARAGETECLGGRCIDPECSALNPALCGAGACLVDSDCTTMTACIAPTCVEGACLELPAAGACAAGEFCQPGVGCTGLPEEDAGPMPPADAGATDAGDAGPVSPPECTTAAECGAPGLVECVARRCVFCAAGAEGNVELRSGLELRADIDLAIHPRAAGPPQVIVITQGMGTDVTSVSQAHIFDIETPSAAASADLLSAVRGGCFEDLVTSTAGVSIEASAETTRIGVVARSDVAGLVTHLSWAGTAGAIDSAGYTCRSRVAPADILGGTVLLETEFVSGGTRSPRTMQVTRELRADGLMALGAYEYPYATERTLIRTAVTSASYAPMTHARGWAIVSGPTDEELVMFDPGQLSSGPSRISTPGRTGWVGAVALDEASPGTYLIAFPVGASVRFVTVGCDSSCRAMGESSDVRTTSMAVLDVRVARMMDTLVMLTSERLATGESVLLLRVLRPSRVPFDAPGGGRALEIDRVAGTQSFADIELAAQGTVTQRYALAWSVVNRVMTSVRTRTFVGTCAL